MGNAADHIAAALGDIPGSLNDKLIGFFSSLEGGTAGDVLTKTEEGFGLEAGGGITTAVERRIPLRNTTAPVGLLVPEGTRIRGSNVTVEPGSDGWPDLFLNWDWEGWIKPQIDRLVTVGGNLIRLISAAGAVVQPAFGLDRETHHARWTQFLDYCESLGIYVYPCGGGVMGVNTLVSTDDEIAALAAHVVQWPNVVAFDVWNEGEGATQAQLQAAGALVRAAAPGLPITYSVNGITSSAQIAAAVASAPFLAAADDADFIDMHIYYDVAAADFNAVVAAAPSLPILIGEFGIGQDALTAARSARYDAVRKTLGRPDLLGAISWALADQALGATPAEQFGMFSNAGVERTDVTDYFRTYPRNARMQGRILNQAAGAVNIDTANAVDKTIISYVIRPSLPMRLVARANADIVSSAADQRFLARISFNGTLSLNGTVDFRPTAVVQTTVPVMTGTFYLKAGTEYTIALLIQRTVGTMGGVASAQCQMELLLDLC